MRDNENIVITKPGKGNGVFILSREYNRLITIINDTTKFKVLNDDPTLMLRKGQLTEFLLKLKYKNIFSDINYDKNYPKPYRPEFEGLPTVDNSF